MLSRFFKRKGLSAVLEETSPKKLKPSPPSPSSLTPPSPPPPPSDFSPQDPPSTIPPSSIRPKKIQSFFFTPPQGEKQEDKEKKSVKKEGDDEETKDEKKEYLVVEPGIVLMKHFLSMEEQQQLADICFEKGADEKSGFYKPQVLIWNKLCQMKINQMCFGLHWNARLHKYESTRSDYNDAPVHPLPPIFHEVCQKVLVASQKLDGTHLPPTSPNSCIVNFYDKGATLGFHRDASEGKKSIKDGKPVISLSIGSSADFQYYYGKDGRAGKKTVLLESGDALVFGGPARMIYHGVPKVYHDQFPSGLEMKQGRLNITFREW